MECSSKLKDIDLFHWDREYKSGKPALITKTSLFYKLIQVVDERPGAYFIPGSVIIIPIAERRV